jgi:hypothetical protein
MVLKLLLGKYWMKFFSEDLTDLGEPSVALIVTEVPDPEISLHAIAGALSPNTMRLVGLLRTHRVVILLDSGSTHCFLDPAVLTKAPFPVDNSVKLHVRVANGAKVESEGHCHQVPLKIQAMIFLRLFI